MFWPHLAPPQDLNNFTMIRTTSVYLILLLAFTTVESANAQSIARSLIRRVLIQQLERKLPDMINDNGQVEAVKIDKLNIGRKAVRVKGSFSLGASEQVQWDEAARFKSRFSLSRNIPAVERLKVAIPGDRFLFFRRYRRIL
jgi:hypothetical protein